MYKKINLNSKWPLSKLSSYMKCWEFKVKPCVIVYDYFHRKLPIRNVESTVLFFKGNVVRGSSVF